jgi:integrase
MSRRLSSVPIARLKSDLEALYLPPFGAIATWKKIRQVLDEFAARAGVSRTSDLTPAAIARWLHAFPDRRPATALTLLSSFRRACTYAVMQGWLRGSPFAFRAMKDWIRDFEPDDTDEDAPARHHPLDAIRAVLRSLATSSAASWEDHRLFALAAATFYTGARALEAAGALAADFDLDAGLFKIRPNVRRRLKTRKSRREVALPPELVPILASWLPVCGSEWAFPGARRISPWMGGSPGKKPLDRLKAAGERCGVEDFTFQSLRHSYITHSLGPWKVPDLVTQQLAGHSSRSTTQGYRGYDRANARAAVAGISIGLHAPALPA